MTFYIKINMGFVMLITDIESRLCKCNVRTVNGNGINR